MKSGCVVRGFAEERLRWSCGGVEWMTVVVWSGAIATGTRTQKRERRSAKTKRRNEGETPDGKKRLYYIGYTICVCVLCRKPRFFKKNLRVGITAVIWGNRCNKGCKNFKNATANCATLVFV